jgi:hypothetical protein
MNPRQLAPTVGLAAATTGVSVRAGLQNNIGGAVASGLIQRIGSMDCVVDNADRFTGIQYLPAGRIVNFGEHRVYVAVFDEQYPEEIFDYTEPLPGGTGNLSSDVTDLYHRVEVMMAGDHTRRPPLERTVHTIGTSQAAPDDLLKDACEMLHTTIATDADPAAAAAKLEEERLRVLAEAEKLSAAKLQMEMETRELRAVYHNVAPSQMSGLRRLGGNVGHELEGDQRDAAPTAPEKRIYDTPAQNMKAAGVAMEELLHLDGDAFERQRQRCKTLVCAANKQQLELDPDGAVSLMVSDTKSHSSSHPSRLEKAGAAKGGKGDDGALMTHKYRGSPQSSREVKPNLLIRHKGSQRILISLNR